MLADVLLSARDQLVDLVCLSKVVKREDVVVRQLDGFELNIFDKFGNFFGGRIFHGIIWVIACKVDIAVFVDFITIFKKIFGKKFENIKVDWISLVVVQ